ncbi:MAG: SIMPL domain-containing protein [Gammaproteobacteria bacterium]|nr:SIMPL domain-containing protein [Gammaproteobacteria bacterium]
MDKLTRLLGAFILGLGILAAGYSIGKGIYLTKKMSQTVTVKGLAEQNVKSDLGIWEINYKEVGNDLIQLDQKLQHDQQVVSTFLINQGFVQAEIGHTQLRVEDRLANIYNQSAAQNANQRYVVTGGVRVRSTKVELIEKTVQIVDKLLQLSVPLTFDGSLVSPNPSYYFTQLDAIRPTMMAEATKSARMVANQFAQDADAKLAGIQHASQGVFQVMGRDTSTMSADWSSNQNALGSIAKKVRLVTTIDYRIK